MAHGYAIMISIEMQAYDMYGIICADVGFRIGNGTSVKYLVIQVHYRKPFEGKEFLTFSSFSAFLLCLYQINHRICWLWLETFGTDDSFS